MNVIPIHDLVIIKEKNKPDSGGLISEDEIPLFTSSSVFGIGEVVEAGTGLKMKSGTLPMTAKVGEELLFIREDAEKVLIDDEEYIIISEADTSAIMAKEPTEEELADFNGLDIDKIIDEALEESENDEKDT